MTIHLHFWGQHYLQPQTFFFSSQNLKSYIYIFFRGSMGPLIYEWICHCHGKFLLYFLEEIARGNFLFFLEY